MTGSCLMGVLAVAGCWLWGEGAGVARVFRNDLSVGVGEALSFDVSADVRYVLKLDGRIVGRGPAMGMVDDWAVDSYRFESLTSGVLRLEAVVYGPEGKPLHRLSFRPGFFYRGPGVWRVADVPTNVFGYAPPPAGVFGVGQANVAFGSSPEFSDWPKSAFGPVTVVREELEKPNRYFHRFPGWQLTPSKLPPQLVRAFAPVAGPKLPLTVPADSSRELVFDLGGYYTAYPLLRTIGGAGAEIRFGWAESAARRASGPVFEDVYRSDGGEGAFTTSDLRAGTTVRLRIRTAAEALVIAALDFTESRYPFVPVGSFVCDDASVNALTAICRRGLEVCAHDGVWDCPFYERLVYLGDCRVQFLAQNVLFGDDRLQKRCLGLFARSAGPDGLLPMNAPCDGPQSPSATYTLVYPRMLGDYLDGHADRNWLKKQLPTLAKVMEGLNLHANAEGLLENLPGWCFVDWADWQGDSQTGCGAEAGKLSAIENLQYVCALMSAEKVAQTLDEPRLAETWRMRRKRSAAAVRARFWNAARALFADDPAHSRYSEHAQALALQADVLTSDERAACVTALAHDEDLTRVSLYFAHDLFEAFGRAGRTDLILKRLDPWRGFVRDGLFTPPEKAGVSRSLCHGWSAHPVYHLARHFAGIRSDGDFFSRVRIAPQPASLRRISCTVPHARGPIRVNFAFSDGGVSGTVSLPPELEGTFVWNGREIDLKPGVTEVSVK